MTAYAKRKLKYSLNENFNLLHYVEWDRILTLAGAKADWGLRYRIYRAHATPNLGIIEDDIVTVIWRTTIRRKVF